MVQYAHEEGLPCGFAGRARGIFGCVMRRAVYGDGAGPTHIEMAALTADQRLPRSQSPGRRVHKDLPGSSHCTVW
jgi:hypothetical protein